MKSWPKSLAPQLYREMWLRGIFPESWIHPQQDQSPMEPPTLWLSKLRAAQMRFFVVFFLLDCHDRQSLEAECIRVTESLRQKRRDMEAQQNKGLDATHTDFIHQQRGASGNWRHVVNTKSQPQKGHSKTKQELVCYKTGLRELKIWRR